MKQKKPFTVVSYYTEGSLYEKEAMSLRDSCEKWDIPHDIESIPHQGSWCKNACQKADFLLKKLEQHNGPVVWTDADSAFMQYPTVFDKCRADVGLRIDDTLSFEDNAKILTGTIFVNNTLSAKKLLQLWKQECQRLLKDGKADVFDQVCLKNVILHYPTIVEIRRLPPSYCVICDHPNNQSLSDGAVVMHYQASRIGRPIADGELEFGALSNLSTEELRQMRVSS